MSLQDPQSNDDQKAHGLFTEVRALIDEYRALGRDHLRLAALETRQAGESVVRMVVTGIVAGGTALITWVCVLGAIIAVVVEQGWLNVSVTLLIAAILHLFALLMLAKAIRKQGRGLLYSATVHHLDPTLTGPPDSTLTADNLEQHKTHPEPPKPTEHQH